MKPRQGTSSRDVYLIKDSTDLKDKYDKIKDPVLQEYIPFNKKNLKDEYTCSFFSTREKKCYRTNNPKKKNIKWHVMDNRSRKKQKK